jgi:hypothetical protein
MGGHFTYTAGTQTLEYGDSLEESYHGSADLNAGSNLLAQVGFQVVSWGAAEHGDGLWNMTVVAGRQNGPIVRRNHINLLCICRSPLHG